MSNLDKGSLMATAVRATKDPLAPIKLENTGMALDQLGPMLAGVSNKSDVVAYMEKLTSAWSKDEIEKVAGDPAFAMALAGMLKESIVQVIMDWYRKEISQ